MAIREFETAGDGVADIDGVDDSLEAGVPESEL